MATYGVKTGFAKCFIFFMAVAILLQGGVYLGLSIWGLTLRQCSEETTDISSNPFQFAMNLIYFLHKECGNPSVRVSETSEPMKLAIDFSKAERVENRTFIMLVIYVVISTLWVMTSLVIITTLCGSITITVYNLCFWPWFLVILSGCILDAISCGYHIFDIINTTSTVKTFEYLSITADERTIETISRFDAYFIAPALVMTCISSRFILIWLLNVCGSSFSLSLSKHFAKNSLTKQCTEDRVGSSGTDPSSDFEQRTLQEGSSTERQLSNQMELPKCAAQNLQANQNPQTPSMLASYVYPIVSSSSDVLANTPLNNRYSTTNEGFQFPMQNQKVSDELRSQLPWSYTSMLAPASKQSQIQVYPEIPLPDFGH